MYILFELCLRKLCGWAANCVGFGFSRPIKGWMNNKYLMSDAFDQMKPSPRPTLSPLRMLLSSPTPTAIWSRKIKPVLCECVKHSGLHVLCGGRRWVGLQQALRQRSLRPLHGCWAFDWVKQSAETFLFLCWQPLLHFWFLYSLWEYLVVFLFFLVLILALTFCSSHPGWRH